MLSILMMLKFDIFNLLIYDFTAIETLLPTFFFEVNASMWIYVILTILKH